MTELPPVTIGAELALAWDSQVRQYPKLGPPGLSFVAYPDEPAYGPNGARTTTTIDCLLYRNRKGHLVGILNHYNDDIYECDGSLLERPGNVNLWVRPDRQRRGIGTKLVAEADRRWSIDWMAQRYTEAGRSLVSSYTRTVPARPDQEDRNALDYP